VGTPAEKRLAFRLLVHARFSLISWNGS